MAFLTYINKEGNLTEIPIDATNIQVLDIKGRFQHKNLEDVIGEIGTGSAENVSRIEQEIGEEELQTESGTIKGAINEVNTQLNDKANNIDNSRTTTAKTVTGAINELNSNKASLANPNFTGDAKFENETIATISRVDLSNNLLNGWGVHGGDLGNNLVLIKIGKMINIQGVISGGTTVEGTIIATIPTKYLSGFVKRFSVFQFANGYFVGRSIDVSGGGLTLHNGEGGQWSNGETRINITYSLE